MTFEMVDYDWNLWVAYTDVPDKHNLKGDLPARVCSYSSGLIREEFHC